MGLMITFTKAYVQALFSKESKLPNTGGLNMNFLAGYRTYISAGLIIGHQILKEAGIDIPQENLSIAVDVILSIAVMVFRKTANTASVVEQQQK